MRIPAHRFETAHWEDVEAVVYPGEQGVATWRTRYLGEIRIRIVDYSAGYMADHWCEKGHVLLCLEGELQTQFQDGRTEVLHAGMSYHVGDGMEAHRSYSRTGARLFIVD